MNSKRNRKMWGISLFIISIVCIINSFSSISEIVLPDVLKRSLGIIVVIMLPIFAYSSIKIFSCNKN